MIRSDSGADIRQLHIDGLRQTCKVSVHAENSAGEVLADVEQSWGDDVLTVYVTLGKDFPLSAPRITTTTGQRLRCAPVGSEWNPQLTVLAEAVADATTHLKELWGRLRPPSLMSLAADLSGLSDDLLKDITENPTCLESFAYQLPICKAMRESSLAVLKQLEKHADDNQSLVEAVKVAREEAQRVKTAIDENLLALRGQPTKLLLEGCSKDNIVHQFTRASRDIQQKCDEIERQCVSLDPSAADFRKSVDQLRENFFEQRIQFHNHELRRRAFAASDKQ